MKYMNAILQFIEKTNLNSRIHIYIKTPRRQFNAARNCLFDNELNNFNSIIKFIMSYVYMLATNYDV